MCYSALIYAGYKRFVREYGAIISLEEFARLWKYDAGKKRPKTAKAMEMAFSEEDPDIRAMIELWNRADTSTLEQELFKQKKRKADAERSLQNKATKKAQDDLRISTSKIAWTLAKMSDLRRSEPVENDSRIYPAWYAPVMIVENGQRVVKPMRYQCRIPGWTEATERQYPGTYNARRDKLETSWRNVFGVTHGVLLADAFYEHVDRDGEDVVLEFKPDTGARMLAACLWTRTRERDGSELLSFAAITDDPPAEVAETGHDRCIIPIKPDHLDAWLNPDAKHLAALFAILDDRERPFYEHRLAA